MERGDTLRLCAWLCPQRPL